MVWMVIYSNLSQKSWYLGVINIFFTIAWPMAYGSPLYPMGWSTAFARGVDTSWSQLVRVPRGAQRNVEEINSVAVFVGRKAWTHGWLRLKILMIECIKRLQTVNMIFQNFDIKMGLSENGVYSPIVISMGTMMTIIWYLYNIYIYIWYYIIHLNWMYSPKSSDKPASKSIYTEYIYTYVHIYI